MTTLGTRLALADLDAIVAELADLGAQAAALGERLDAVRAVLSGDVLDLRERVAANGHDRP